MIEAGRTLAHRSEQMGFARVFHTDTLRWYPTVLKALASATRLQFGPPLLARESQGKIVQ